MSKEIVLYTQELCPFCEMAKALFRKHNVPHVIRNTSTNFEARREFLKLGSSVLPAFIIDGHLYEGFEPEHLRILIRQKFVIDIPKGDAIIPKKRFNRLIDNRPKKIIVPFNTLGYRAGD
ncbi:glutaredoxin family protein [Sulfoacidibacillus thermotolerans]|uniref:Glutaredoxin domain-containing protein n=1 Tax=Sulfoacidibacillus thermotolerans TaxID=1765684 RepID=A0A2U3CVM1_SULT2|nr:glutaredoxin family protein [Sulfoacidibacillus thermotolerans]PWI53048.1 hypothetical protein BM613_14015 [Sulfoacidibacillus thermotolerans]